ncbi:prolyl oligopeptidase family serine peptidase [Oceanotoga sp.]|uniref:prolyl oligopeptidase family serine peptidase n=1 Tax=Oceanotoga sp. TaxID=2108366 RepID=UPI0028057E28|nr:prolyl oligopeptidase family serine peptidase [Oceanotoga sp.]
MGEFNYPKTKKVNQIDEFFGVKVKDPYRWMENEDDPDLKIWINQQNEIVKDYMKKIPYKEEIKQKIKNINKYTKYMPTTKIGTKIVYRQNENLQNQDIIKMYDETTDEEKILIDCNDLSIDGTTTAYITSKSKDNKYITYNISESGSDWQKIKIKNIETNEELKDEINWVKFGIISWYKDGFYYTGYEKQNKLSSKNESMKIYYHKLNTSQENDEIIYQDSENPERFVLAMVTHDEKYLMIITTTGTYGEEIKIKKINSEEKEKLLFEGFDYEYQYIGNIENELLFITNKDAPNNKIIKINPETLKEKDFIKESNSKLEYITKTKDKFYINYLEDVQSKLIQFDINGKFEKTIPLPDKGIIFDLIGNQTTTKIYYIFSSLTYPETIMSYDSKTGKTEIFKKPDTSFNSEDYITEQIFYNSKDNTSIPMFIVRHKNTQLNSNNPTILYAYGGFDISVMPVFNPYKIPLLEMGGIYAIANIRGGGEYGQKWHKAGMMHKKQNVFDDFIAAAEYLIQKKYTSKEKLAIEGRSNGGLLIGAVINQRPDLFRVAFPTVGVMDMLRFHKFTIGWGWKVEYGCAEDDKEQFNTIYKYSPLHNIKQTQYPAIMVRTADHDDRVVPAHSFKYTATLQEISQSKNPILIRIDTKSGHGMGKSMEKLIDENADTIAFMLYNMEIQKI